MSIIKHVVVLKTGFHFSFMHATPVDWEHVRAIINDKTVEVAQARWDGENYEMLCDENALSKNNVQLNQKATMAYRSYWHWYNQEVPDDARSEIDINRRNIWGNVILIKQPYLNK